MCFQLSLREEDKVKRKSEFAEEVKDSEEEVPLEGVISLERMKKAIILKNSGDNFNKSGQFRGNSRGRNNFRGRFDTQGRGPTVFTGKCFHCHQMGHIMNWCPEKDFNFFRR